MKTNKHFYIISSFLFGLLVLYFFRFNIYVPTELTTEDSLNCFSTPFLKYLNLLLRVNLLFIAYYSVKDLIYYSYLSVIAWGLISAGTLSNIAEFMVSMCVYDYYNFFNIFKFNLADVFITGGVLTMLVLPGIKKVMYQRQSNVYK